ncbi:MAG: methyl-accepting chemotaxis protein, partial [Mariprofundaceae bacterium]
MIGLIFVASATHSLYQISTANEITRSISAHDVPTWNAIMGIKVDLVTGHLWFEEAMAGDRSISKDMIFDHWIEAKSLVQLLLLGGEKDGVRYFPVESDKIRRDLDSILNDMDAALALAQQRYQASLSGTVGAGSADDQAFDTKFDHMMDDLITARNDIATMMAADNMLVQDAFETERISIIAALLIMLASGLVIAVYISQRVISQPLKKITDIVRDVSDGDLSKTAEVKSQDELGLMARDINTMTDKLSTLMGHLQQSGLQVASSVTEIAASTKEQEATATEHAATTNQVAASVKEIASTSRELGQTTDE